MIARCKKCDIYQSVNSTYRTYYNLKWTCKHCLFMNTIHVKKRRNR